MFIKTFSKPDYPSDLELTDNTLDEIAYEDNHWDYMNRFPDYINRETIYTSKLVEPGKAITDVTLSRALEKGEYPAVIKITTTSLTDGSAMNGADVETVLIAQ